MMIKSVNIFGYIVLQLCICGSLYAKDSSSLKQPSPFGRPDVVQSKQINNIIRSFQRFDFVGDMQQRKVREVGTIIVPYLVSELEMRRERIRYDRLIGKSRDSNEMVIDKVTFALVSFAIRDMEVLKYLLSRLNDENTFRCVKLIEIAEEVAISNMPENSSLIAVKIALERAKNDIRIKVVHTAEKALDKIGATEQRFKGKLSPGSITFQAASLTEGKLAIRLLNLAANSAASITKIYFRDSAYEQIVNALLMHNDIQAAITIADLIAEKYDREKAIKSIALHVAANGDELAISLSDGFYWQHEVIKSLAITLSRIERSYKIASLLSKIKYKHQRDEIVEAIASDQLTRGKVKEALASAKQITSDYSRFDHLILLISLSQSQNNHTVTETIVQETIAEAKRNKRESTRILHLIKVSESARLVGLNALSKSAFNDALTLAYSVKSDNDLIYIYINISYEAVKQDEFDIAKRLATLIERNLSSMDNVAVKSGYRAAVAVIRIMSGYMVNSEQRKILSLIPSNFVEDHLVRLAKWAAARGDMELAFAVVNRIREISTQPIRSGGIAVNQIVLEQHRIGDYEGALKVLAKWPDLNGPGMKSLISHVINSNKYDIAVKLASRYTQYSRDITKALVDVGAMREALQAVETIRSRPPGVVNARIGNQIRPNEWGDVRGDILARIVITALKHDRPELVQEVLKQIQYPLTRGILMCDLASVELMRGEYKEGEIWANKAIELIPSISLESSKTRLQSKIVENLIAMGLFEDATEIDRSARNENVTRSHAVSLIKAGRSKQAIEMAEGINNPSVRAIALTEMAVYALKLQQ